MFFTSRVKRAIIHRYVVKLNVCALIGELDCKNTNCDWTAKIRSWHQSGNF